MSEDRIIRRTRAVARGALRQEDSHVKDIDERLQSIALARLAMATQLEEIAGWEREVEALMKQAKMSTHEAFGLVAEFVEVKTNQTKEVTVEACRKALKNDKDFYACLKVQLTTLKTFLSENEIDRIAKITPGKVTGQKFQIIQPKTKVGKGVKE